MQFEQAVVLYGCSVIAGGGVLPRDRLAVVLASKISRPVLDLSQHGGGCDLIAQMQSDFHRRWGQPWMEIVCWTDPVRFIDLKTLERYGGWNIDQWPPGSPDPLDSDHWREQALNHRREFLARNPQAWEFTWNPFWHREFPEMTWWSQSSWPDRSPDGHPGPEATRLLADQLAREIYNR